MDRFLVQLRIGYPDFESQMAIIRDRQTRNPLDDVRQLTDRSAVLEMQREVQAVTMRDEIVAYLTRLAMASREHPLLALGVSPRGALSLSRMARACAYLRGRDYVIPEDVREVFADVCAHRVILSQKARLEKAAEQDVMAELLQTVKLPNAVR